MRQRFGGRNATAPVLTRLCLKRGDQCNWRVRIVAPLLLDLVGIAPR
jgi:hypothetical protein